MEENKIIAEMLSVQEKYCKNIPFNSCLNNCQVCRNKALVEAHYIKLQDGEMVLSKEDAERFEQYKKGLELLEHEQNAIPFSMGATDRKRIQRETAREILYILKEHGVDKEIIECCTMFDVNGIMIAEEIAKKYDVEVE